MVTDAVLWGLAAAAIAFLTLGCRCTRQAQTPSEETIAHTKLDRAA